jgi:hypothetical protein
MSKNRQPHRFAFKSTTPVVGTHLLDNVKSNQAKFSIISLYEIGNIFYKIAKDAGVYFEFSTNEKVALEASIGASFSGLKYSLLVKSMMPSRENKKE